MVPWLLVQGLLGLLLAGLALYYLIIFPDKADCMPYSGIDHQEKAVNNRYHPYKVMKILKKRAGAKFYPTFKFICQSNLQLFFKLGSTW